MKILIIIITTKTGMNIVTTNPQRPLLWVDKFSGTCLQHFKARRGLGLGLVGVSEQPFKLKEPLHQRQRERERARSPNPRRTLRKLRHKTLLNFETLGRVVHIKDHVLRSFESCLNSLRKHRVRPWCENFVRFRISGDALPTGTYPTPLLGYLVLSLGSVT